MTHREDRLLRQIAELEALEDLDRRHELDVNTKNQPRCPVCLGEWHGLNDGYCPGAWATADQKQAYHEALEARSSTHIWVRGFNELMYQQASAVTAPAPRERGVSATWTHQVAGQTSAIVVSVHHPLNGALLWSGRSLVDGPIGSALSAEDLHRLFRNTEPF